MDVRLDFIGIDHIFLARSVFEAVVLVVLIALTFESLRRTMGLGGAGLVGVFASVAFAIVGDVSITAAVAAASVGAYVWKRNGRQLVARTAWHSTREISMVLLVYGLYELVRIHSEGGYATAQANAREIIAFEKNIGLFFERELQDPFLNYEWLLRSINFFYSFSFLAVVAAVLLWLFVADERNYRLMRNSLGISVVLASLTFTLFPVAPPRLMPETGIVGTVALLGRTPQFVNEFAAVPSLHVGWMSLSGYVLGRSIGGRVGRVIMPIPGVAMGLAVIITGNHWWIDGMVGISFALLPALLMVHVPNHSWPTRFRRLWRAGRRVGADLRHQLLINPRVQVSVITLGGLLIYMVVNEYESPGFTDYWGYLVFQMAVTMVLLVAGEIAFADQGGLSWQTHIIAVLCTFADTLGTDGNLYARIDEYDKVTHFAGVAAVTSGTYDCLRAINLRRGGDWPAADRMRVAILVGVTVGVSWEVYELIGDKVFNTSRIGGWWDTSNDIFSDTLGALFAGVVLYRNELLSRERVETSNRPAG